MAAEWVRLYTSLLTHPKAEPLSDRAWRSLTLSWVYAGQHETGGHIPDAARRVLRATDRVAAELEAAGWWERNGDGWHLHDWSEHQEGVDALAEMRRRAAARKAEERRRKREDGVT